MRKTILKWLILTSLIAYVTAVTVWANEEAKRHTCQGIEVSILTATSADSITINGVREELKRFPKRIEGIPLNIIDTREIEDYLSGFSNFEDVECALTNKGYLSVAVRPMIPEIRVFDRDSSYYINKDGKRIESKANFFVDVPVVSGNFTPAFTPKMILPVSRFVQNDPLLSKLVGMIEARDADNIILVPRIRGHVINFGDTNRLQEKKLALLTVYRKVIPYKGWEAYDTISVKFRGQVVATRSDKSPWMHGVDYEEDDDPEESTLPDLSPTQPTSNH